MGSSPLARGLPMVARMRRREERIIPARAGFTVIATSGMSMFWDHPRSRGVYRTRSGLKTLIAGSSPLARGLLE